MSNVAAVVNCEPWCDDGGASIPKFTNKIVWAQSQLRVQLTDKLKDVQLLKARQPGAPRRFAD
jgi:hypothetical protein